MAGRSSAARRAVASFLPLLCGLAVAGCRPAERPLTAVAITEWVDGPARWLILPDEERRLRRLRTNQEAVAFLEDFWNRRDPDPDQPGNPFLQVFSQRVEAADRLYGEGGTRGSLTDRGRALILLGPPPLLGFSHRPAAAWAPGHAGRPPGEPRKVKVETWTYAAPDLPPALVKLLEAEGRQPPVVLTFLVEPRGTFLFDGGKLLDLAARAAVREPQR